MSSHSTGEDGEQIARNTTYVEEGELEKHGHTSSAGIQQQSNNSIDASTEITYHYLTFATPLPPPSTFAVSGAITTEDAPPQPNLKKFTNPLEWSDSKKRIMIVISCLATNFAAFTAGSYSPGARQMSAEWDVSQVQVLAGITTFCTGFAIAPMVLAPFSEINGRYPVFVGAGVVFVLGQLCCAVTRSHAGMMLARLTAGIGSSVFSTMVGGVVSDLYDSAGRNTPMALFSGFAFFGTGLGPLVSGFIAQNTSWRWIFWIQVITCGWIVVVVVLFFEETRGSILLSRKAIALNIWIEKREKAGYYGFEVTAAPSYKSETQRIRWKVKSDEERESVGKMISISVYRPFHLLLTEPVVFFFSLWVAFAWAVLYLTFGSIPLVFSTSYGFDLQQSNSVFAALCVGAALATTYSIYQDRLLLRFLGSNASKVQNPSRLRRAIDLSSPEGRLYFACLESILLPVGLFWFGWSQGSSHWIVPTMAITCATMGIYSVYLATFNYLADSYGRYASSALAAQSFCRNMLGGIFPLFTTKLFVNLTFRGATSLLGGLACVLTIVPWVLTFYGPKIRARSKFASGLV